jgi:hypothetical protein
MRIIIPFFESNIMVRMVRLSSVVFFLLITALAGSATAQKQPPFGDSADSAYAGRLWQTLVSAKLAGPQALQTKPYTSQHPHGAVSQTIYARLVVDGQNGDVIVKRNYGGNDVGSQAVAQEPGKFLQTISVMFKRPGYAPAANDWFWVSYLPDGTVDKNSQGLVLAGRIAGSDAQTGCTDCHRSASGADLIFTK